MGLFDDHHFSFLHQEYNGSEEHKAKLSHEILGGAAAYEAAKAYEEHKVREGSPDSHEKSKEVLAGLIGAGVDRLVETKGLDFVDKEKAKRHAEQQAYEHYCTNN